MPLGEVSPDPVAEVSEGSTAQFSQHRDFTGFEGIVWLTTALRPTDSTTRQFKSVNFDFFFRTRSFAFYIALFSALQLMCASWLRTRSAAAAPTVRLMYRQPARDSTARWTRCEQVPTADEAAAAELELLRLVADLMLSQ